VEGGGEGEGEGEREGGGGGGGGGMGWKQDVICNTRSPQHGGIYSLTPQSDTGVWECDIVQVVVDYASEVKYTEWLLACVCCTMLHMR